MRFILLILCSVSFLGAEVINEPLTEVWKHGDALNIEGGLTARSLKEGQIWANLCFILDRPFHNGVELKDITEKNRYPLKEANIMEYNERRTALATALVMKYYITKGKEIAVQVHRNSTGPAHVRFLERLIGIMGLKVVKEGDVFTFPEHRAVVELHSGVLPKSHEKADIILSISLAAGIHPEWESGTIMIPHTFTPFDIHSMGLMLPLRYEVDNHLLQVVEEIVALQDQELIDRVRKQFASANTAKADEPLDFLKVEDFHPARILQINGIFNPSTMPKKMAVL